MLGAILRWVTGGGLSGIASQLRQAQKDRLDASNDKARLAADERVKSLQAQMLAQTSGEASWLPKAVRAVWTLPFVIYTAKVIVWDKVLGWGVTDGLGSYERSIGMIIVGFYFLDATIGKIRR
jgi:hypothetical protein